MSTEVPKLSSQPPSVSFPFPETNLAQGVRAWKPERVKIRYKMGEAAKKGDQASLTVSLPGL